jgi:hypothetical protein
VGCWWLCQVEGQADRYATKPEPFSTKVRLSDMWRNEAVSFRRGERPEFSCEMVAQTGLHSRQGISA